MSGPGKAPRRAAASGAADRFTVRQIRLVPASDSQRRAAVKALAALMVSATEPHDRQPDPDPDEGHLPAAKTGPADQQAA